jgi:predicted nuclease of predicted toxin-antitoxin system
LEKIKLYIDEDITDRLAVVLRSRGYDVISAHEVEMRGKTDIEQLVYATNNKRVILTQNVKHFIDLQREYFKKGLKHYGILLTNILPFKELIRRVLNFLNRKQIIEMRNNLDWLHNYK